MTSAAPWVTPEPSRTTRAMLSVLVFLAESAQVVPTPGV
jgi:hypothetical protein